MHSKRVRPPYMVSASVNTKNVLSRPDKYTQKKQYKTLPLPPYGTYVVSNLHGTEKGWIIIEVGPNAWTHAKSWITNGLLALVLPEPHSYRMYRWPVARHDVLLHWPDARPEDVYSFGSLLVGTGANVVLYPYTDTWVYPQKAAAV